jgi:hypothetical protein
MKVRDRLPDVASCVGRCCAYHRLGRGSTRMSVHEQFLALAACSFVATVWAVTWAFMRQFTARWWIVSYYGIGYVIIAAAFMLDEIFAPPLFVHGFVPGIGSAFIVEALLLVATETCVKTIADRKIALWVGITALCGLSTLVALAWSGAMALARISTEPSARFMYGMLTGMSIGALVGALGLWRHACWEP